MSYREEYENTPIVIYGEVDGSYPAFYRICPKCARFVKADNSTKIPEYLGQEPNATCRIHGRVQMPFAMWLEKDEVDEE